MDSPNLPSVPGGYSSLAQDNLLFDQGQLAAMMKIADVMSQAKLVPEHLQGKPADCLLVIEQARRWGMSPFAVAQETYVVKGKLLFGGKLVTAVINSRAPIKGPLRFAYSGEGDECEVTVSATLRGEDEPRPYSITVGKAKAVAGNSSLWKTEPKQQVAYFAARFWARLHCPETILGVWSEDEVETAPPMRDITPTARDTARASAPPPDDVILTDPDGEERAIAPGEAEGMVKTWCAECTDEQLGWLAENNPDSPLVAVLVEAEQARRAAAQDDADPLGIKGKSLKAAVTAIEEAIGAATAVEADQLWRIYRDKVRSFSQTIFDALEHVVLEKIGAGRLV